MYELRAHDIGELVLQPLTFSNAELLGRELASMEPWVTIGWPADRMIQALQYERPSMHRFQVLAGGELAGIITIQEPWLHGPYLQLLAILPAHQGKGFGLRLLTWMEAEARSREMRQLWLCVSTFNTKARQLYERFGFQAQSVVEKLASDASDELLMRKRLRYG